MTTDAVVVGAGVVGCALAWELAQEGMRVRLLDRQKPAAEASWAAAGMLAATPEGPGMAALVPLNQAGLAAYPSFVEKLEAATGLRVGYRRQTTLVVFLGPQTDHDQGEYLAALAESGLVGEPLTGEEARQREPTLNPKVKAAVAMPGEACLDTRALGRALVLAAVRQGVELQTGAEVKGLLIEGDRCRGVLTANERIPAGHVVIAAGCYSAGIERVARYAPTRPARGQMLAIDAGAAMPGSMLRSIRSHLVGYLVPREDGRLLAGSTIEDAGFDKSYTPGGMRKILDAALEMIPGLENAPILEAWAGLRPDTPDHLPILGPTDIPGLSIATGHFRDGILLAPVTARLARRWILGREPDLPLAPFSPLRFIRVAAAT